MLTLFWTSRDPYDPTADWKPWLEAIVGQENVHWKWDTYDVVPGDTDERTVISLHLPDKETELLFLLANECEVYEDLGYRNIWW